MGLSKQYLGKIELYLIWIVLRKILTACELTKSDRPVIMKL